MTLLEGEGRSIYYGVYLEDPVEIPLHVDDFVREYEKLCQKHGLMILSDGEPIQLDLYRNDLWSLHSRIAQELRDARKKEKLSDWMKPKSEREEA